jgi:hypothetical protein
MRRGSFSREILTPFASVNSRVALMGFTVTSVLVPAAAAPSPAGSVDAPHPTSTDPAIAAVIQPRTRLDGERSIDALASSHGTRNPLKIHDNRFHKRELTNRHQITLWSRSRTDRP